MGQVNVDAIREDLKKMGLTATQVSRSLGKSRTYIAEILSRGEAGSKAIRQVEKALFREEGAYEIKSPAVQGTQNECAELLRKLIEMQELMIEQQKAQAAIMQERITDLENEIKQNSKWTARLLAYWQNGAEKGDQNG